MTLLLYYNFTLIINSFACCYLVSLISEKWFLSWTCAWAAAQFAITTLIWLIRIANLNWLVEEGHKKEHLIGYWSKCLVSMEVRVNCLCELYFHVTYFLIFILNSCGEWKIYHEYDKHNTSWKAFVLGT